MNLGNTESLSKALGKVEGVDNYVIKNKYDQLEKNELIKRVREMTPEKFNYDETLITKMNSADLHNKELIPMMVELYEYLQKVAPYKKEEGEKKLSVPGKKYIFIKPKFDVKEIISIVEKSSYPPESLESLKLFDVKKDNYVDFDQSIFSIGEFESSFRVTGMNKDMMGVSKKLLSFSPKFLKARYLSQINKLYRGISDVNKVSFGRASYLYKQAKKGKSNDIKSFRQIITIPTVVNHMHRILAIRANKYISKNKYINTEIQKGGVINQKFGIFEQIFKVKNSLQDANKNNQQLALMFLDISNAFGNLNLDRMAEVLKQYHFPKMFIDYIKSYYKNFQFYTDTDTIKTDVLDWKKGLIQGCPLSPTLFALTLNYVLQYLQDKHLAERSYQFKDGPKVLFTVYMDDICVMCNSTENLKVVTDELKELLLKIGLEVNQSKCAAMYVNEKSELNTIEHKTSYKYLGEIVNENGKSIESFTMFVKELGRKLYSLNKTKHSNENKGKIFFESVLPWLQRKAMIMYDVTNEDRLKVIALVNDYLTKWKCKKELKLFALVTELFKTSSQDKNIKEMNLEDVETIDTKILEDLDLVKATLEENEVGFTYDSINSSDNIDNLLNKM